MLMSGYSNLQENRALIFVKQPMEMVISIRNNGK